MGMLATEETHAFYFEAPKKTDLIKRSPTGESRISLNSARAASVENAFRPSWHPMGVILLSPMSVPCEIAATVSSCTDGPICQTNFLTDDNAFC